MFHVLSQVLRRTIHWLLSVVGARDAQRHRKGDPVTVGRKCRMDATALNDRRCAGTRCAGFLGKPAVIMLG